MSGFDPPIQYSPDAFLVAKDTYDAGSDASNVGVGDVVVVVFERGRFLSSQEIAVVSGIRNEFFILDQEVVDMVGTKEINLCSEFESQTKVINLQVSFNSSLAIASIVIRQSLLLAFSQDISTWSNLSSSLGPKLTRFGLGLFYKIPCSILVQST